MGTPSFRGRNGSVDNLAEYVKCLPLIASRAEHHLLWCRREIPKNHRHMRADGRRRDAVALGTERAAAAAQRRRIRSAVSSGVELGTLGQGRPARIGEPRHHGEAQAGDDARENGRVGVARAQSDDRARRGQQQPVRAHDAARQQHGSLCRVVPRLRAQPHRRAVPHPVQGPDLQRLPARRGEHRERMHEARHRQPEERRHHARRAGRHPTVEGRRLSRAWNADLR